MMGKEDFESVTEKFANMFISEIAEKYSIEKEDLESIWENLSSVEKGKGKKEGKEGKEGKEKKQSDISKLFSMKNGIPFEAKTKKIVDVDCSATYTVDELFRMTKPELSVICKSRNLKCTGNKAELIERITGETLPEEQKKTRKKKTDEEKEEDKKNKKSKNTKKPEVLKKLEKEITFIGLRKNSFGNYEHPPTKLVIDKDGELAIGTQEEDGTISELTEDTIELCKQYKFNYKIPENLDSDIKLENVKIEGIDEDDIIDNPPTEFEIVDEEDEDEDLEEDLEDDPED